MKACTLLAIIKRYIEEYREIYNSIESDFEPYEEVDQGTIDIIANFTDAISEDWKEVDDEDL